MKRNTSRNGKKPAGEGSRNRNSGRGRSRSKADPKILIVKRSIRRNKDKPRVKNDQIWINYNSEPVNLPCELKDGDTICCYDPDATDPDAPPDVNSFTVETDEGEKVIEYNYDENELEIDMSVLDVCDEDYNPGDPEPYNGECTDPPISIGING